MVIFYSEETAAAAATLDDPVVCHCLQVTESTIHEAVASGAVRSLCDLRRHTGAGGGCSACHLRLRRYLPES